MLKAFPRTQSHGVSGVQIRKPYWVFAGGRGDRRGGGGRLLERPDTTAEPPWHGRAAAARFPLLGGAAEGLFEAQSSMGREITRMQGLYEH